MCPRCVKPASFWPPSSAANCCTSRSVRAASPPPAWLRSAWSCCSSARRNQLLRNMMTNEFVSEGDVNTSPGRQRWLSKLEPATRQLLDEDEAVFLRQSLSTPCL